MTSRSPKRAASFAAVLLLGVLAAAAGAQPQPAAVGATAPAIHGVITTQGRSVRLPGATINLLDGAGSVLASTVTDAEGSYRLSVVQAGELVVIASLDGFDPVRIPVHLLAGQAQEVNADLDISKVTESMQVVQQTYAEPMAMSIASKQELDQKALQDPTVAGGSVDAALRMLAGVVFGPEGLSIRGGRPSQSAMVMGGADLADASVGATRFQLPSEAVSSVEVLPNPYAVEFGRFSSGITLITTRKGSDVWHANINNLEPGWQTRRGKPWKITGVKVFAPHAWFGGPLVKDRVFLAQTNHLDYRTTDIRSRPESDRTSQTVWSSFTRIDANVRPGHTMALTFGVFPEKRTAANLDTFTPPASTFDVRQRVYNASLTDARTLSSTTIFETTLQASRYSAWIEPSGTAPMQIQPDSVGGSYFNQQARRTNTVQWLASLASYRRNRTGEHLLKAGADLVLAEYDGTSVSAPVEIRRADGTLARRITFGPASHVEQGSTDVGLFLQDRWRPTSRLLLELGVRMDRDGALGRFNFTPRSGVALLLRQDGSVTLRGGAGLFFERTPLVARAFTELEDRIDQSFAGDGVTPLGAATYFRNTIVAPLQTPVARTWNVEYDHRLNRLSFHVGHLERHGSRELIVEPDWLVPPDATRPQALAVIALSSTGRSVYHETEFSAGYRFSGDLQVRGSYLRSSSLADLNNYASFFGAERRPVIGHNEFAPTPGDARDRFIGHLSATFAAKWMFASFVELRTGFPYTAIDENQDFVGPRGRAGRFPSVALADLALERKIKFWKWTPWVGVQVRNALDVFAPLDVQRNTGSAQFGTFYNSVPRQIRLTLRIQ